MAISNMKATFHCDIQKVWELVTSLTNYSWRSDLSKIEILSEKQFVEYTKDGYATTFTITTTEPRKRWEFDMENDNMQGHWRGVFSQEGSVTTVDFTEEVTAKKAFLKPFVGIYLKKQQSGYVADLRKALEVKPRTYCILVTGMPASGKSTVAKYLSENMEIPMISKDNIKELLFDEIGFRSRQEKNKLGRASTKIMYHVAEQMMQAGVAFILECNFELASREELLEILNKYHYTGITVRLTGEAEKIYARFAERDRSPERHRGHVVNDCYPEVAGSKQENPTMLNYEKFLSGIERRGYDSFTANGPCIVVDTTDFSKVNMEDILKQVKQSISTVQ